MELDTVVSLRGKSKGYLATFVLRKTRFYVELSMKDRSKESMLKDMKKLINPLSKLALKTDLAKISMVMLFYIMLNRFLAI